MRTPEQFVAVVRATIARREICILYETGESASSDPNKVWPEMGQAAFRGEVARLLKLGSFSPPDELDDWTFVAYPSSFT